MGNFHQYKFKGCRFDYFGLIRLRDMKEWYSLILVRIPVRISTKGCDCSILECCAMRSMTCHMIETLDVIT